MENLQENNTDALPAQESEGKRKRPYPVLDYTITDPQERNKIVH